MSAKGYGFLEPVNLVLTMRRDVTRWAILADFIKSMRIPMGILHVPSRVRHVRIRIILTHPFAL